MDKMDEKEIQQKIKELRDYETKAWQDEFKQLMAWGPEELSTTYRLVSTKSKEVIILTGQDMVNRLSDIRGSFSPSGAIQKIDSIYEMSVATKADRVLYKSKKEDS